MSLCRYEEKWPTPVTTWTAGQSVTVEFEIEKNTTLGGLCQFSISYNGKDFAVIDQVKENCFKNTESTSYTLTLPDNLPASSSAVFAWSWLSPVDAGDFYMNCADIAIKSNKSSKAFSGVAMSVFNYPGYPEIQGSSNIDGPGLSHYMEDEVIEVGPGITGGSLVKRAESEDDKCDDTAGSSAEETEVSSEDGNNPKNVYEDVSSSTVEDYDLAISESEYDDDKCDESYIEDSSSVAGNNGYLDNEGELDASNTDSEANSYSNELDTNDEYSSPDTNEYSSPDTNENNSEDMSPSELEVLDEETSSEETDYTGSTVDNEESTIDAQPALTEEETTSSSYFVGPIGNSKEPPMFCTTSPTYDELSAIYYTDVYASDTFDYMSIFYDLLMLESYGSAWQMTQTVTDDEPAESDGLDDVESSTESSTEESTVDEGVYATDDDGSRYLMFEISTPGAKHSDDLGGLDVNTDDPFTESSPATSPPTDGEQNLQLLNSEEDIVDNSLFLGDGIE
ncbi:hypothetical protein LPJ72_003307 [Coemansia sp. Benny D160-2]|nr:hypothetical protein LPJ72_003307 [Coemansia sp. Benny D160-2]